MRRVSLEWSKLLHSSAKCLKIYIKKVVKGIVIVLTNLQFEHEQSCMCQSTEVQVNPIKFL